MSVDLDERLTRAAQVTVFQTAQERALDETMTTAEAAAFLGVPDDSVTALLDRGGLPAGSDGLAYHDVAAIGLNSGLGTSVAEQGLAMMMRFARQPAAALLAPLRWSFRVQLADGVPADGPLEIREPHAGAAVGPIDVEADGRSLTGQLRTNGTGTATYASPVVTELHRAWVNALDNHEIRFQWVSEEGRRDPLRRMAEGRIDCVCLAAVATVELQRAGLATRLENGRVLGLLDARHVWTSVLDDDGAWKRFDPLLEAHCRRLWGAGTPYGQIFRGHITNALPGWPGLGSPITVAGREVPHVFTARRDRS